MNLVVNARDSMPEGGEILISTAGTEICEPMLRDRVAVPKARLCEYFPFKTKAVGLPLINYKKFLNRSTQPNAPGEGTGLGFVDRLWDC